MIFLLSILKLEMTAVSANVEKEQMLIFFFFFFEWGEENLACFDQAAGCPLQQEYLTELWVTTSDFFDVLLIARNKSLCRW